MTKSGQAMRPSPGEASLLPGLPPVRLIIDTRPSGEILLQSAMPLVVKHQSLPLALAEQARLHPGRIHLAEREAVGEPGWRNQTFAMAKAETDAVAQWLLDRNIEPGRPVLILSGNSIAHATIRYGAMAAGVPVCAVSANYSLMGAATDYERLRYLVSAVRPAVIFAETPVFAAAAEAVAPADAAVVSRNAEVFGIHAFDYQDILATAVTEKVNASLEGCDPDAPAVYMFTSGSTGKPKTVPHTQRMIMSFVYQGWQALGHLIGWDEQMLDWLPWSHASGTISAYAAATFGGSLYIDGGMPLPGAFEETIRNLREVPVRFLGNVPAGYGMLAAALEADESLRQAFFQNLRVLIYGGAALPQPLYDRLQAMAEATHGKRIFFSAGYGATETTSGCMSIYFPTDKVGIGLPMPGVVAKLVPDDDRYELRMKGPMVMKGYLNAPEANAAAFDDEGFYRMGDTVAFHDPADPAKGLYFTGRLAEEFKLNSGIFVRGGEIHDELLRLLSPMVLDLLVCGEGRDEVAILAWPGGAVSAEGAALVAERLAAYNSRNPASSRRIGRLAFLAEPPSIAGQEVSDKGTINQNAALRRRSAEVERLYSAQPAPDIMVF